MPKLIALRRGEPILDRRGLGTIRFVKYIEDLTRQVNDSASNIDEISSLSSSLQQVLGQLSELLKKQERLVNTSVDNQAQIVEIISFNNTSLITVTTTTNPIKGDVVPAIKRTGGKVKVLSPIDGKAFKIINVKFYSMKLAYNGTEWIEV